MDPDFAGLLRHRGVSRRVICHEINFFKPFHSAATWIYATQAVKVPDAVQESCLVIHVNGAATAVAEYKSVFARRVLVIKHRRYLGNDSRCGGIGGSVVVSFIGGNYERFSPKAATVEDSQGFLAIRLALHHAIFELSTSESALYKGLRRCRSTLFGLGAFFFLLEHK